MKHKRVAIIGAACVGKTSLLESIFKSLENDNSDNAYIKIPEIARSLCKEQGYENIYEIKDADQFRIDVLNKQIDTEDESNTFISDRSTIDCWVYYMRWSWNSKKVEATEEYYQKAKSQAQKYDKIIFIPKMFDAIEDDFRWANDVYQMQVERTFKSTLYEWELLDRTYTIKSSNLEERVAEVFQALELNTISQYKSY